MIIKKNNNLKTDSKPIIYDLFYKKNLKPKPVVIFCHGYKGFKDWGAWDIVAKNFAKAGFFFIKFNFSHNGGTVKQPIDFPDLEAFAENNYTKELNDLDQIISLITTTKYEQEIDKSKINLIGHSRSGGIVLIKGEEDTRINKVITWAGVSDYKSRFNIGSPAFNTWIKTGRFYVKNGRTKQQMPHNWQFYEDFAANEKRLTIKRAAQKLKKPFLIIHGEADTSVPLKEAIALHQWSGNSQLYKISEANHVFGAKHPWEENSLPNHLENVVQKTIWFISHK